MIGTAEDTGEPFYKDMVSKFKESYSLKCFSSESYKTSLICNSKTFKLNVNLIDGFVKPVSSSKLISNSLKNVPIRIEELKNLHDLNSDYSKGIIKSSKSFNFKNKYITFERTEDVSNNEDLQRYSTVDSQNSSFGDSKNSSTGDSQRFCAVESQRYYLPEDSRRFSTSDFQRSSIKGSQNSSVGAYKNFSIGVSQNCSIGALQSSSNGALPNSSIEVSQNSFIGASQNSIGISYNSTIADLQRPFTEDKMSPLIVSIKRIHKPKSLNSDPDQTQANQKCSDFKSLQCDICQKYYSSARSVRRHRVLHSLESHPCEICGKVFRAKENLKRHCKAMHEVKVKSTKCFTCFKAYSSTAALKVHLKKRPDHVLENPSTIPATSVNFQLNIND